MSSPDWKSKLVFRLDKFGFTVTIYDKKFKELYYRKYTHEAVIFANGLKTFCSGIFPIRVPPDFKSIKFSIYDNEEFELRFEKLDQSLEYSAYKIGCEQIYEMRNEIKKSTFVLRMSVDSNNITRTTYINNQLYGQISIPKKIPKFDELLRL